MEFTKIKKITKNVKQCYDVTVANNHNLFINKHLVHNSDFRGEIGIILANLSENGFYVNIGDKVAQAVINKYEKVDISFVENLSDTERGEGGFGSTGVR